MNCHGPTAPADDTAWVRKPFFAKLDAEATWFDQLRPAFGKRRFFFEEESASVRDARHEMPEWAHEAQWVG